MPKLLLHVDELRVESFDTLPTSAVRTRTVRAHQDTDFTCAEKGTCGEQTCDSCQDTCKPPTCGGHHTCGDWTCEGSCPKDTCDGNTCGGEQSCAGTCDGWTCEGTCGENSCNSCQDTCEQTCGTTCLSRDPCCDGA